MERNGGSIAVTSVGDRSGCTFSIRVPVYFAQRSATQVAASVHFGSFDEHSYNIVVMDDDDLDATVARGMEESMRSADAAAPSVSQDGIEAIEYSELDVSITKSEGGDIFAALSSMATKEFPAMLSSLSSWKSEKKSPQRRLSEENRKMVEDPRTAALITSAYERLQAERISFFAYNGVTKKLECIISQDICGVKVDSHQGFVGESIVRWKLQSILQELFYFSFYRI